MREIDDIYYIRDYLSLYFIGIASFETSLTHNRALVPWCFEIAVIHWMWVHGNYDWLDTIKNYEPYQVYR